MRLWYPPFSGSRAVWDATAPIGVSPEMPGGGARTGRSGWPRGEPVSILFLTSWLRLFPRAEHFLPQATAPARAAVWCVPAAAPLAATEHWLGGVAPTGPMALRSPLLTS